MGGVFGVIIFIVGGGIVGVDIILDSILGILCSGSDGGSGNNEMGLLIFFVVIVDIVIGGIVVFGFGFVLVLWFYCKS